jgi:hypothetical protein
MIGGGPARATRVGAARHARVALVPLRVDSVGGVVLAVLGKASGQALTPRRLIGEALASLLERDRKTGLAARRPKTARFRDVWRAWCAVTMGEMSALAPELNQRGGDRKLCARRARLQICDRSAR